MKKNNRKKIIILTISVLLMLLILFIGITTIYNYHKEYNRKLIYKEKLIIKIGDEVPSINDFVSKKELKRLNNTKIKWEDINPNDNRIYNVGVYSGSFNFRSAKIKLNFEVIDDEKPIIEGSKDVEIYVKDEVDLLKNINVTDNSHDKIEVSVNGDYDTSKKGEYRLYYLAIDKGGNETIEEFKLIVKEKEVKKEQGTNNTISSSSSGTIIIGTSSSGYTIKKINDIYYIDDFLIVNKSYSLPSNYAPGGLKSSFTTAFNNMKNAASHDNISLNIISGYRSYNRQRDLYYNYVNRDGQEKADTYSARAGHSEHQSGLAADINSLSTSFINTMEGKWLNDNCYKYGFIIRYPKGKETITGYMYEPWHIRYVGTNLANKLYNNGDWISMEEYFGITSNYNY